MHRALRAVTVLAAAYIAVSGPGSADSAPPADAQAPATATVDRLLGGDGRARLARRLEKLSFDGRTYPWRRYAAWGEALFHEGSVADPPEGPKPSPRISKYPGYTCSRCHNDKREDPVLTEQDPEARYRWIRDSGRSGLAMTQGATLWGVVNRTSFYNGHFSIYHDLCVPVAGHPDPAHLDCGPTDGECGEGCRRMDNRRVEDAVQICARYCCVGDGYLADWELHALLAYLWDLELHLEDLDLDAELEAKVRRFLPDGADPEVVAEYRARLADRFLTASGETYRGLPEYKDGRWLQQVIPGPHREGRVFRGDAARGRKLYRLSCANCHGEQRIGGPGGTRLVQYLPKFYEAVAEGTYRGDRPYMPEFVLQRMSHQQVADIRAYLESLEQ